MQTRLSANKNVLPILWKFVAKSFAKSFQNGGFILEIVWHTIYIYTIHDQKNNTKYNQNFQCCK